jgi:anti-sigma B factor antagonist
MGQGGQPPAGLPACRLSNAKPHVVERRRTVPEPQARRRFNIDLVEGILVVTFTTPRIVQEEDIQATFEQLQALVDEKAGRELILDFRKVQFLSSSVLGRLVLLQKKVAATKGRMILCAIAKEIFEVFKITKLDKVFTVKEDAKAALKAYGVSAEDVKVRQRLDEE